jgi:S1-C subfamily serine protease
VPSDWEQSGFTGVEITDISEDGSAALAGLHKGDVITEVNGIKLRSTQDLSSLIGQMEPGSKISIVYLIRTNLGWMPKETSAIIAKEN